MVIYSTTLDGRRGTEVVYDLLGRVFYDEYGGDLPEIEKTLNGKPYFPDRPEIFFSLSHSRTHVLCALSDHPVGVDIESPREISARALTFFCSPDESALFEPLDLWVLKESYIKLMGGTLGLMKVLRFSREGDGDVGGPGDVGRGTIIAPDGAVWARLYHFDGCCAAVCSLGGDLPEEIIAV